MELIKDLEKRLTNKGLFSNKSPYKLSENSKNIGAIFETVFLSILKNEDLMEGKDFLDLRSTSLRCKGLPDFFFPKSNTFVEIKSGNNSSPSYNSNQVSKIKFLKEKGFKVKTLFFNVSIRDSIEDSTTLPFFINNLTK